MKLRALLIGVVGMAALLGAARAGMADTTYYRVVANNSVGTTCGDEASFTTTAATSKPTATTLDATGVTISSATLNGMVNANGASTRAWFEYGTTQGGSYTSYTKPQSVSGPGDVAVTAAISGLTASKTYYYRVAALNRMGTTYGSETSFTTVTQTKPSPTPAASPTPTATPTGAITAEVSIKPETINLQSKGKFKAFIKLPSGYNVDDIDPDTVTCDGASAIDGKTDDSGRFIATFNVKDLDLGVDIKIHKGHYADKKVKVKLTVSGELKSGVKFEGSDTVTVKGKGNKHDD